jgi:uncharacterized protein (TIGR00369 family)
MSNEDWLPKGFVLSTSRGPFTTHNGPLFHKIEGERFWQGFQALPRHCNAHGIVHGGWLSAFADGLLGMAVWRATQTRAVTLRLNTDYLGMVRSGEWVEGTAHITRATRTLAFARGEVTCGGRAVVSAEGVFKLMTGRGGSASRK